MDVCNLCQNRVADKPNSHILSKFLGIPLFDVSKDRHAVSVRKNGKRRKVQDTPKEDFILCTSCEKRIEIMETYFARILSRTDNYKRLTSEFEIDSIGAA